MFGVPVSAVIPDAKDQPTRVHVDGPVSFDGTVSNLWVWITRPLETSGGSVQLRPGATLVHPRMHESEVVADLVLDAGDYATGEDKEPKEVVGPVTVPCYALQLAPPDDDDEAPTSSIAGGDRTWWTTVASNSHLRLFAEPTTKSWALDYRISQCDGCRVDVQQLETRGSWMRVGRIEDFASHGALCSADVTFVDPNRKLMKRKVHLRRGTRLQTDDGEREWGTVTSEEAVFEVRYLEGNAKAVVDQMPDTSVDCALTWVPVAAVLPLTDEPR